MVPLKKVKEGFIEELNHDSFSTDIIDLCEKHKAEGRALAFAFLMFDFQNPQIVKIIEDKDYWNALHQLSGSHLSIFYINSKESHFGKDLNDSNIEEKRGLYEVDERHVILPIIKHYFELNYAVKLPSILFFQVADRMVIDYFLVNLEQEKIEDSFLELNGFIKEAVSNLEKIKKENYENSQPIFDAMKRGVNGKKFKTIMFKRIGNFPVKILIRWILGKL